jgi:hypothetical protein
VYISKAFSILLCENKKSFKINIQLSKKLVRYIIIPFIHPGLGPNNKNTRKNSLNSCKIFEEQKLLTNISDCIHIK